MNPPVMPGPHWRVNCTKDELNNKIKEIDEYTEHLLDQRELLVQQLKRTDVDEDVNDIKEEIFELKAELGEWLTQQRILELHKSKK